MNCGQIIIENLRIISELVIAFLCGNVMVSLLFLLVCLGTICAGIRQIWLRKYNHLFKSLAVLLSFSLAFGVYKNVSYLMDTWLVFQISNKCYATGSKIEDNVVTPSLINEGGNVSAYIELVRSYNRTKESSPLKKVIKNQLDFIYNNVKRAQRYAEIGLWHEKNTKWKHKEIWVNKQGKKTERNNDFDVRNIILQLEEPNYWRTRLTAAKYLINKKYLKEVRQNKANLELLEGGNYAVLMYKKLMGLIERDPSLIVRVTALDTFVFWACSGDDVDDSCRSNFISDRIYNFDVIGKNWKEDIVKNFNETIGLKTENRDN